MLQNQIKAQSLKLLGIDPQSFSRVLETLPLNLWIHDENYKIFYGNSSFSNTFGAFQNKRCHQLLMGKQDVCSCCRSKRILEDQRPRRCKLCTQRKCGYELHLFHTPIISRTGHLYILKSSLYLSNSDIFLKSSVPAPQSSPQK